MTCSAKYVFSTHMNSRILLFGVLSVVSLWASAITRGDDPADGGENEDDVGAAVVVSETVREALVPLFSSVAMAEVSRVTVELSAESAVAGEVVNRQTSSYQIASIAPDRFTIYYKEANQGTRVIHDGESVTVVMSPHAYLRLPDAMSLQDAAISLPVPMGPYPEPIMSLSLAGVDPAVSLFGGMASVELMGEEMFRGEIPSTHVRGVQKDGVSWDLWISTRDDRKPLRLVTDLTEMLKSSGQVSVPDNFSYQLRADFLGWRMSGDVDEQLFRYTPPQDAMKYKSLEEYYESLAGVVAEHPLLGEPAPPLVAKDLNESEVRSDDLAGKVVILGFWATWCEPCIAAVPVIDEVADRFSQQGVVYYAVSTGEDRDLVSGFVEEQGWDVNVLVDSTETIADAFKADALPQTVVIGKSGIIESVHIGFAGTEALKKRLTDELEVLIVGGKIASSGDAAATAETVSDAPSDEAP
jgi:thiol-disulfide isomerase/thioredoxin